MYHSHVTHRNGEREMVADLHGSDERIDHHELDVCPLDDYLLGPVGIDVVFLHSRIEFFRLLDRKGLEINAVEIAEDGQKRSIGRSGSRVVEVLLRGRPPRLEVVVLGPWRQRMRPRVVAARPHPTQNGVKGPLAVRVARDGALNVTRTAQMAVRVDGRNGVEACLEAGVDLRVFHVAGICRQSGKKKQDCERQSERMVHYNGSQGRKNDFIEVPEPPKSSGCSVGESAGRRRLGGERLTQYLIIAPRRRQSLAR